MNQRTVESFPEVVVDLSEKKQIHVLHVDDELDLLKVAKQCLELQGPFHVDSAASVEEALNKLKEKEYDVVVSDYQMPEKDGLQFLEMLRKNGDTIPFVMFTGKGREEVAVKAWSMGADHYVNKTGNPETVYCELAHCLRSTVEKRLAETRMKETVRKLQTIYQNAVEGITYMDAEENIVYANKAFADIIGYEPEQLAGMNARTIVDDENWAKIGDETRRRRQGESSRYEAELRKSDGTVRSVLISGAPLLDQDGRFAGTIGIVLDITERKKAEETLRTSEERYRSLFENSKELMITYDLKGNLTAINKVATEYGFARVENIGRNMLEFVPEEQWPRLREEAEQILQGKCVESEIEIETPKGKRLLESRGSPIREGEKIVGIHGSYRDVTERKKAEEALGESEAKFRDLFENAMDGIVTLDLEGRISAVNSSVLRFGYRKEDLVGGSIFDFVSKEYQPAILRDFSKVAQGEPAKNEVGLITPTGKIIVEYNARAIVKKDNPAGVQINIRDVTERKKSEKILRDSEEKHRSLVEQSTQGIVIAQGPIPHMIFANAAMSKILGYTVEELTSLPPQQTTGLVHPDDRELFFGRFKDRLEGKPVPPQYEIRGIRKDGTIVWLELSSVRIEYDEHPAVQAIFTDITERKKTEQRLMESEEKYRDLVELAPDGIVAVNLEGIVTLVNTSFLKLVGYDSEEEIVGKPFTQIQTIRPEDTSRFQEIFTSMAKGESLSPVEFLYVRKDGTSRWAEVHPSLMIRDGHPVGVQAIISDVSERKNTEKLNQENQQLFEQLFMGNPEAAAYVDPNERVLSVNPRFTEFFGYSFDEVQGRYLDDFVVPEDRKQEALMLAQKGRKGYLHYETVRKNKKGFPIPVIMSSAPIMLQGQHLGDIVLYKDITELKKAQEESEESKRHFQMLFDLMADPVAVVDGRGKILEVTQKVEEITGFKKEELVGENLLKIKMFGTKTKAVMIKNLAKRMMGMHLEPYEVEVLKKDGGKLIYEINAAKIDYKGKPADLVVFRDVMERKNLEEKLRVVGSLTRHDVRNKLTAVTGNAYLLKRKLAGNPEALEQLADMEKAVRNTEAILEFARTYEKLGSEQLVNMDVSKAVDEAASLFPDLKGVKIVSECGGLTVLADSLFKQLFYNLIDDSLKYGEKLTQIRIHYERPEDQLRLIYEDDGVGVPYNAKCKLFNEGFTTGKGSGYGLYLIRRMMEVYGWAIEENGEPGKGARFVITVPKMDARGRENYKITL